MKIIFLTLHIIWWTAKRGDKYWFIMMIKISTLQKIRNYKVMFTSEMKIVSKILKTKMLCNWNCFKEL